MTVDSTEKLTSLAHWSRMVVERALGSGDLVLDLTAGNGHDTAHLASVVGPEGLVVAWDIQAEAIASTAARLSGLGVEAVSTDPADAAKLLSGDVTGAVLIEGDHSAWAKVLTRPPRAVVANLGYLPGGDKRVTTGPEATLAALEACIERLQPGGVMAITCYTGHPGGEEEAQLVSERFASLPSSQWRVLQMKLPNLKSPPFLLVAEKN